jgi:hypothetical protein
VETPLVVIDFRTKTMYAVADPKREPKIAKALADTRADAATLGHSSK